MYQFLYMYDQHLNIIQSNVLVYAAIWGERIYNNSQIDVQKIFDI